MAATTENQPNPVESISLRENLTTIVGQPNTESSSTSDLSTRENVAEIKDIGSFFPWYTQGEDGPVDMETDWAGDDSIREYPLHDY